MRSSSGGLRWGWWSWPSIATWVSTPLYGVIVLNVVLFTAIMARMISASTLTSAIPSPQDRGAFMAINVSVSQLAGGLAAFVAGLIVVEAPNGHIEHYDTLGFVVMGAMLATIVMMYPINKTVKAMLAAAAARAQAAAGAAVARPVPLAATEGPPPGRAEAANHPVFRWKSGC